MFSRQKGISYQKYLEDYAKNKFIDKILNGKQEIIKKTFQQHLQRSNLLSSKEGNVTMVDNFYNIFFIYMY